MIFLFAGSHGSCFESSFIWKAKLFCILWFQVRRQPFAPVLKNHWHTMVNLFHLFVGCASQHRERKVSRAFAIVNASNVKQIFAFWSNGKFSFVPCRAFPFNEMRSRYHTTLTLLPRSLVEAFGFDGLRHSIVGRILLHKVWVTIRLGNKGPDTTLQREIAVHTQNERPRMCRVKRATCIEWHVVWKVIQAVKVF